MFAAGAFPADPLGYAPTEIDYAMPFLQPQESGNCGGIRIRRLSQREEMYEHMDVPGSLRELPQPLTREQAQMGCALCPPNEEQQAAVLENLRIAGGCVRKRPSSTHIDEL